MSYIINLFNHYGYLVLFISLALELIAFPLPGEALMTYCGYVIYINKMNWMVSILLASVGAICGITASYFIGKLLGVGFFERHGHFIHLDKKKIDKISLWFQGYGSKLLIMAYFIPGIRHITGYFSGMTRISYKKFAVNAYSGAFIWTFTFISLGKVLGANWEKYHSLMTKYLIIASLIAVAIIVTLYVYRNHRQRIKASIANALIKGIGIFHSLGRLKLLVAGTAVVFLVFTALVIGIIQDYIANEFGQFDEVVSYIVSRIYNEEWSERMGLFRNMSSTYILLAVVLATTVFIAFKNSSKLHEIRFLIVSCLGGIGLSIILKILFHRLGPSKTVYTFPSGEVLISTVVYGFLAYNIVRKNKRRWITSCIIAAYLILCASIGLSMIYFNLQYPSDVAAGFEFGVVWISLSVVLMEIFRVLNEKITQSC